MKALLEINKSRTPFILALGNQQSLEIKSYFIILEKICIPCDCSFMSALDICYKTFVVLGLDFPIECKPQWQYIDHVVYQRVKEPDLLPPSVKFLVGQTNWRSNEAD